MGVSYALRMSFPDPRPGPLAPSSSRTGTAESESAESNLAWDHDATLAKGGLSRRERLQVEREARLLARPRTGLRLTAVTVVIVGLLVWLTVSWLTSPSSSSDLPEPPELGDGQRPDEEPPPKEGTESAPEQLIVHVAGAVDQPGIVELPGGARVHEALEAAGGAQGDAALDVLNLAAEVQDGSLLTVPTQQEVADGDFSTAKEEGGPGQSGATSDGVGSRVDLNHAQAAELEDLPGIGPALSERIVTHREQHGSFESLEDLAAVSGVGPAVLADLEDLVTW